MNFEETKKRVEQADLAAKQERLKPPEVVQKTKAVRRGGTVALGKKKLFRWIGEPSGWSHGEAHGCVPCVIFPLRSQWLYEDPDICPHWSPGKQYEAGAIVFGEHHPSLNTGCMYKSLVAHTASPYGGANHPGYGVDWQDYWDDIAMPVWLCEGYNSSGIQLSNYDPIWGIEMSAIWGSEPVEYGGLVAF